MLVCHFCCVCHLFGMPVPPVISKLMDAVSDHHWCIPFSVSGNPEPKLSWLLNGKPVEEGPFIRTMIHDYSEGEYHGCLHLDSPTHINNGKYKLLASNTYGEDRKAVFAHFMHEPWNGKLKFACNQIKTITVNVTVTVSEKLPCWFSFPCLSIRISYWSAVLWWVSFKTS